MGSNEYGATGSFEHPGTPASGPERVHRHMEAVDVFDKGARYRFDPGYTLIILHCEDEITGAVEDEDLVHGEPGEEVRPHILTDPGRVFSLGKPVGLVP